MAWRSVLVHLEDDARCDARVDVAVRLAHERDARLIGVAPTGWVDWMYPVLPSPIGAEQLARAAAQLRRQAGAAAQRFVERCKASSLEAPATVVAEGDAADVIVEHGHCSDVIVLGQADASRPDHRALQAFVERVVLHASRPVLVVPYAGSFGTLGKRIVVAWDGGREAARALGDALPMLYMASDVRVVHFAEPGDAPTRVSESLRAVEQWLQWHGVNATVHAQTLGDIDIGDALLSFASDATADALVMGAYGHPRWSERVLGGATRSLLRQMTVPVLLSR
jgi:nucleotide-binding universal stress UspA family protein